MCIDVCILYLYIYNKYLIYFNAMALERTKHYINGVELKYGNGL